MDETAKPLDNLHVWVIADMTLLSRRRGKYT
jgi:hypothetical protein